MGGAQEECMFGQHKLEYLDDGSFKWVLMTSIEAKKEPFCFVSNLIYRYMIYCPFRVYCTQGDKNDPIDNCACTDAHKYEFYHAMSR